MGQQRRFLNEPAGSTLNVLVANDPLGSATIAITLIVNGVPQAPQPAPPGILIVPCPQPASTYIVQADKAWLAAGLVVLAPWLEHPAGNIVNREPMISSGAQGAVDVDTISVLTA